MEEIEELKCHLTLALFPIYQKYSHHFSLRNTSDTNTKGHWFSLLVREEKKKGKKLLSMYHTGLHTKALGSKNKRVWKIFIIRAWREKWYLRKLGLYRFKFAPAIVPELTGSQLWHRRSTSLCLTLLSRCSALFLSIWGFLVRLQDSLRTHYCDPLWIFQRIEKRGWHYIRKKVVTSRYQMTGHDYRRLSDNLHLYSSWTYMSSLQLHSNIRIPTEQTTQNSFYSLGHYA